MKAALEDTTSKFVLVFFSSNDALLLGNKGSSNLLESELVLAGFQECAGTVEARGERVEKHVDSELFDGDFARSRGSFRLVNQVDQLEHVLRDRGLAERKGCKFLDSLILAGDVDTRMLTVEKVPHVRSGLAGSESCLDLGRAVKENDSLCASRVLDDKWAVTLFGNSFFIVLFFVLQDNLDGEEPEVVVA